MLFLVAMPVGFLDQSDVIFHRLWFLVELLTFTFWIVFLSARLLFLSACAVKSKP